MTIKGINPFPVEVRGGYRGTSVRIVPGRLLLRARHPPPIGADGHSRGLKAHLLAKIPPPSMRQHRHPHRANCRELRPSVKLLP